MGKKLLIVDDNDLNRVLLRDLLRFYGYEVIEADNGAAGARMAREQRPNLVLLDIQMPVMDGYSTIAAMRRDPALANVNVIAITSYAMPGDREKMIAAGFDGYIPKPIDIRSLPERIREWLAARKSA